MFIEQAVKLLKPDAFLGFIIPITWQTGDNYLSIRKFISENSKLEIGIILPYNVFADAYVDTGVYIFRNQKAIDYQSLVYEFDPKNTLKEDALSKVKLKKLASSTWRSNTTLKIIFNEKTNEFQSKFFFAHFILHNSLLLFQK